jgi:hypothetical protein
VNHRENDSDYEMAAGFATSIYYCDGYGSGRAPRTGELKEFSNQVLTLHGDAFGVDADMGVGHDRAGRVTGVLRNFSTLVDDPDNRAKIDRRMGMHPRALTAYRNRLIEGRSASLRVLSDGFWPAVYDRYALPLEDVRAHLETEENPKLRSLLDSAHGKFERLYNLLRCVRRALAIVALAVFSSTRRWGNMRAQCHVPTGACIMGPILD